MKKIKNVIIVISVLLMLSCSNKTTAPTFFELLNPDKYDFALFIHTLEHVVMDEYGNYIEYTHVIYPFVGIDLFDHEVLDEISVFVNSIQIQPINYFYFYTNLNPGERYLFEVRALGKVYKAYLNAPYDLKITNHTAIFESDKDYFFEWEMENSNSYQSIELSSYVHIDDEVYESFGYSKSIHRNRRHYTIKANSVSDADEAIISLTSFNYSTNNGLVFIGYAFDVMIGDRWSHTPLSDDETKRVMKRNIIKKITTMHNCYKAQKMQKTLDKDFVTRVPIGHQY